MSLPIARACSNSEKHFSKIERRARANVFEVLIKPLPCCLPSFAAQSAQQAPLRVKVRCCAKPRHDIVVANPVHEHATVFVEKRPLLIKLNRPRKNEAVSACAHFVTQLDADRRRNWPGWLSRRSRAFILPSQSTGTSGVVFAVVVASFRYSNPFCHSLQYAIQHKPRTCNSSAGQSAAEASVNRCRTDTRPSALAALRLRMNSNLVGCSTGRLGHVTKALTASYHCGGRTVGPVSAGDGKPGAGGCGSPAGASNSPQLVRARIWSRVAAVTK